MKSTLSSYPHPPAFLSPFVRLRVLQGSKQVPVPDGGLGVAPGAQGTEHPGEQLGGRGGGTVLFRPQAPPTALWGGGCRRPCFPLPAGGARRGQRSRRRCRRRPSRPCPSGSCRLQRRQEPQRCQVRPHLRVHDCVARKQVVHGSVEAHHLRLLALSAVGLLLPLRRRAPLPN